MDRQGFCIYVNTVIDGPVPVERDQLGNPIVYDTPIEAQRVVADDVIDRLQEFIDGEREYEDAMTVEEFIVKVNVLSDGSIMDGSGVQYGGDNW